MEQNFSFVPILNITPDSFSDGGELLNPEKLLSYLDYLKEHECTTIDVGAQSTAPMNSDVGLEEEKKRLEFFLDVCMDKVLDLKFSISLDTYRPELAFWLYERLKIHSFEKMFIWNDVSGVWDRSVDEFLKLDSVNYIYSHNLVRQRNETNQHMSYVNTTLTITDLYDYFAQKDDRKGVIFDPCFGFAKSLEQNLKLLGDMPLLFEKLPKTWMIGISRKSFLRKFMETMNLQFSPLSKDAHLEILQLKIIQSYMNRLHSSKIWLRGHDPSLYSNNFNDLDFSLIR